MKAALIDATNTVQNIIVWDSSCVSPEGLTAIVLDDAAHVSIGFIHNADGTFTDPNPPAPPVEVPAPQPTLADLQAQLAALTAQINAMAAKPV